MLKKFVVHFDPCRFEGECYNVQEWCNLSDEKPDWDKDDWCYCGNGRFCSSFAEAEAWAESRLPSGQVPLIVRENC